MAMDQIEKLNSELEVIDSIFNGEGVVVQQAIQLYATEHSKTIPQAQEDISTESDEGKFETMCVLNIMPNAGADEDELRMVLHCRFIFDQAYPFTAPRISFMVKKGMAEEQFERILASIKAE